MTFPIAEEPLLYTSLFQNCRWRALVGALNRGFMTDDRIFAVVHSELPRRQDDRYISHISAHGIELGDLRPDRFLPEDGVTYDATMTEADLAFGYTDHKFGGIPCCIQEPELPGAEKLFSQGYLQVLQIDFPGCKDGRVSGSWFFGGGMFNLFWKPPFENVPYYWYLQG